MARIKVGQATLNPRSVQGIGERNLSFLEQIYLNLFWFANNFHWQALQAIVIPSQVAKLFGETHKGLNLTLVVVFGTVAALIINPLTGALSDYARFKIGRRRPFMIIGTIFNIIALIAMAYATQLWVLALLFILLQASNNVANAPWSAIIADNVPKGQRGSASGIYGLLTLIGLIGGATVAGSLLNKNVDLSVYKGELLRIYLIIAIIQAVFVTLTVLLVPEKPLTKAQRFNLKAVLAGFFTNLGRYPDFLWLLATRTMMMMGIWSIFYFLQYFFDDVYIKGHLFDSLQAFHITINSGEAAVGTVFLPLLMLGAIITVYFAGSYSDRHGRKVIVYISGAVMTAVALLFIFVHNLPTALLSALLFGVGFGAYTSVDWALATDVLPPTDDYGKDMGIWTAAGILPQIAGITLGGLLLNSLRSFPNNLGYSVLFMVTVVCFFLGTFFVFKIKGAR